MSRASLFALALLVGCFQSRSTGPDAPDASHPDADSSDADSSGDAGSGDAAIGPCEPIGPYAQCSPECGASAACPEGTGCYSSHGMCIPWGDERVVPGSHSIFCPRGDQFLYPNATCFPYEFCRALPRSTRSDHCKYSNGEPFLEGPPLEACPPPADSFSPFCGRGPGCQPCSREPSVPSIPHMEFGRCTGINEERGVGVCAAEYIATCVPEDPDTTGFYLDHLTEGYFDTPAVCLVERRDGDLDTKGFILSLATCRAYQALYPDDFACVDPRLGWRDLDDPT